MRSGLDNTLDQGAADTQSSALLSIIFITLLVQLHGSNRIAPPVERKLKNFQKKRIQSMQKQLTVIITHEEDGYVSLCPEFDIASQGESIEEARENLREALELFFETASSEEIQTRLHEEVYVTRMEVAVG